MSDKFDDMASEWLNGDWEGDTEDALASRFRKMAQEQREADVRHCEVRIADLEIVVAELEDEGYLDEAIRLTYSMDEARTIANTIRNQQEQT